MVEILHKKPEAIYSTFVTEEHFFWNCSVIIQKVVNPFVPKCTLSLPPENLRFSDVFRGLRKGALGTNGLKLISRTLEQYVFKKSAKSHQNDFTLFYYILMHKLKKIGNFLMSLLDSK